MIVGVVVLAIKLLHYSGKQSRADDQSHEVSHNKKINSFNECIQDKQ